MTERIRNKDEFRQEDATTYLIEPCPCCGNEPQLFRYSEYEDDPLRYFVSCATTEGGPRGGLAFGCLLGYPPADFYQPTRGEAIRYWNEVGAWLRQLRANNAKR